MFFILTKLSVNRKHFSRIQDTAKVCLSSVSVASIRAEKEAVTPSLSAFGELDYSLAYRVSVKLNSLPLSFSLVTKISSPIHRSISRAMERPSPEPEEPVRDLSAL